MFALVKDNTPLAGPSAVNGKPSDKMKEMEARTGGKIIPAEIVNPLINPRMQMYGTYSVQVRDSKAIYIYPVLDIPIETVRENLIDFVGKHAEERILKFAPYWKQINAITDPDPDLTARIKAVRDASNALEAEIKAMDRDGLAALVVEGWSGWPE